MKLFDLISEDEFIKYRLTDNDEEYKKKLLLYAPELQSVMRKLVNNNVDAQRIVIIMSTLSAIDVLIREKTKLAGEIN
jgi:hypothetical protein